MSDKTEKTVSVGLVAPRALSFCVHSVYSTTRPADGTNEPAQWC